jgi:hypothetical protein
MNPRSFIAQFMGVFAYSHRAVSLVWQTSTKFTLLLALFTLCAGILPTFLAYIGQLIVDGVVLAAEQSAALAGSIDGSVDGSVDDSIDDAWLGMPSSLLILLCVEAIVVMGLMATQRGISGVQS